MPLILKQKREFLIAGSAVLALCFTSIPLPKPTCEDRAVMRRCGVCVPALKR